MKSLCKELGRTYHIGEDRLLYPDLLPPTENNPHYGKHVRQCCTNLNEHHEALHVGRSLSGNLHALLNKIGDTANAQMKLVIKQMALAQGITEEMKERNQMAWVWAMENLRSIAEEYLVPELIYG